MGEWCEGQGLKLGMGRGRKGSKKGEWVKRGDMHGETEAKEREIKCREK